MKGKGMFLLEHIEALSPDKKNNVCTKRRTESKSYCRNVKTRVAEMSSSIEGLIVVFFEELIFILSNEGTITIKESNARNVEEKQHVKWFENDF
ncbi:hypothetical protein KOY_00619 [Bacillus cereus VDM021]|uniref:Uncharacterized protein n=2 Tax=Bacillaceae TaxID=186817 RepID=A0A1Y3MNE7_9BACI|nr:hypothetical protein IIW_00673 [Bacillus cereus VD136]EOP74252.1 hypothetical protein KOW_00004 [Bacillus cereus VDM006]EOQ12344.1 hypothetical protein KOY_00619 [Bacillus cereus VDM021]OUM48673.1 hypothetical protein BW425_12060 [Bacillus pseudomycoides]PEK65449.1 hypothetical protein CN590_18190 [Bacillus pseudomycoides]